MRKANSGIGAGTGAMRSGIGRGIGGGTSQMNIQKANSTFTGPSGASGMHSTASLHGRGQEQPMDDEDMPHQHQSSMN